MSLLAGKIRKFHQRTVAPGSSWPALPRTGVNGTPTIPWNVNGISETLVDD
jgi:hypothetical protein